MSKFKLIVTLGSALLVWTTSRDLFAAASVTINTPNANQLYTTGANVIYAGTFSWDKLVDKLVSVPLMS